MSHTIILIIAFSLSQSIYGQPAEFNGKLSRQDSILLNDFWLEFKTAINATDKAKMATLCDFPFYCRPCTDDSNLKDNNHVTIRVTRKLFDEREYKVFFDRPIKQEVDKHKHFETYIFRRSYDNRKKANGFMFSYTIVPPSNTWEGLRGFIYLRKINHKYKITGIDTVP